MKRWLSNFFSNPPKRDLMLNHRPEPIIENPEFRSGDRQKTIVLPTLACPIPEGHNAIWCSSFQLAWNELRKLLGGTIEVDSPNPTVSRLNASEQSEGNLERYSYYAAAGFGRDGIIEKIRKGMKARFPAIDTAFLPAGEAPAIYLFAYLEASLKYKTAFDDCPDPLLFRESNGTVVPVSCFGFWPTSNPNDMSLAWLQVHVLYDRIPTQNGFDTAEFALDLSSQTMPYQLVVAQLRPAMTLEKLIQDLECKIAGFSNKHILIQGDTLRVPNILFRITQEFAELEGTNVTNVGPIVKPTQIIDFKLDRFGAEVASRADAKLIGIGLGSYLFDQPFLVLMKRRGNKHPFFAMWVDNAGLLKKA